MNIEILTLFPEMFTATETSMLGRAQENQILNIKCHNVRDYSLNKHKKVDDYTFGGGPGMVMMAQPIFDCLETIGAKEKKIVYMSPKGPILNKEKAEELSKIDDLVIVCGHYEGIDERILTGWKIEEISIGDYILTGGEPAAMVLIDVISRLIPKVIGNENSIEEESIYSGLLEAPQYTKPREYENLEVPEILLSGNHEKIRLWRFEQALQLTKERRPDLLKKYVEKQKNLSKKEREIISKVVGK